MSLYGIRYAAVNFQKEVSKFMVSLGLEQAKYNTSLYCRRGDADYNRTLGVAYGGVEGPKKRSKGKLTCLAHGDDFVASWG